MSCVSHSELSIVNDSCKNHVYLERRITPEQLASIILCFSQVPVFPESSQCSWRCNVSVIHGTEMITPLGKGPGGLKLELSLFALLPCKLSPFLKAAPINLIYINNETNSSDVKRSVCSDKPQTITTSHLHLL